MATIVWQKPDGTLAITGELGEVASAARTEAISYEPLMVEKDALLARAALLESQVAARSAELQAVKIPESPVLPPNPVPLEGASDEEVAAYQAEASRQVAVGVAYTAECATAEAQIAATKEALQLLDSELLPIKDTLQKIAFREHIIANVGLTEPEHAAVLKAQGNIPADWQVVGYGHSFNLVWGKQTQRWDGDKIVVDLPAAREETKNRLRREREPLLQAQDVSFQRALEIGVTTAAIVAEKQRLRDITQLADTATTLDELGALKVG